MSTLPLLLGETIPSILIIGVVFILVGLVFAIKPELSLPVSEDAGPIANAAPLWGRLVAVLYILLGGLFCWIGIWNLLYAY